MLRLRRSFARLRLAFAALVLCAFAPAARATWSVIVVDRVTGEVVVTSVTCLPHLNLRRAIGT